MGVGGTLSGVRPGRLPPRPLPSSTALVCNMYGLYKAKMEICMASQMGYSGGPVWKYFCNYILSNVTCRIFFIINFIIIELLNYYNWFRWSTDTILIIIYHLQYITLMEKKIYLKRIMAIDIFYMDPWSWSKVFYHLH